MDFYKIGLQLALGILEDKLAKVSNKIIETGIQEELAVELDECQDTLREIIKSLKGDNNG